MTRDEAEGLLGSYLRACSRAEQSAHLAFGPSTPQQREAAEQLIRESQVARERLIQALLSSSGQSSGHDHG